jgi:hypothetical protein
MELWRRYMHVPLSKLIFLQEVMGLERLYMHVGSLLLRYPSCARVRCGVCQLAPILTYSVCSAAARCLFSCSCRGVLCIVLSLCNCIVLILCAQQVVKFPCGEQITVKFEQLQGYAKNFRWLSPQFEKLAAGQSDETWHCFLTIKPVLALGVVRSLGPNPEQMEAMCDHLDQYQPALSRDAVQIDSE